MLAPFSSAVANDSPSALFNRASTSSTSASYSAPESSKEKFLEGFNEARNAAISGDVIGVHVSRGTNTSRERTEERIKGVVSMLFAQNDVTNTADKKPIHMTSAQSLGTPDTIITIFVDNHSWRHTFGTVKRGVKEAVAEQAKSEGVSEFDQRIIDDSTSDTSLVSLNLGND